jgi:hypothetical protein
VASVLGQPRDRGNIELALERQHAEHGGARGCLAHHEGSRGFAPQGVIDEARDGGAVAGAGEAMREAPVLERIGSRAPPRLDIGKHLDGSRQAGPGRHGAQLRRFGREGKARATLIVSSCRAPQSW